MTAHYTHPDQTSVAPPPPSPPPDYLLDALLNIANNTHHAVMLLHRILCIAEGATGLRAIPTEDARRAGLVIPRAAPQPGTPPFPDPRQP